ncbi:XRE family transcriptional regulator [Pseudomonas putida]|uniref:XRE family transcriptional regulator n=1 Tax=Pseudomonas putida TaxID=303 RepID=A0A2Z4RL51_PSEPU|nr:XRE family transcriptional regulator [Pseudomonas putida]AWY41803.1 XRE family transcriptional regulator [Pseudomonas putida]
MSDFFPLECADSLYSIGLLVKQRRLQHKQRQKDLAASLSMSERTVRKIEAGDPSVELRSFMLVLWQLGLVQEVFQNLQAKPITVLNAFDSSNARRVRLPKAREDF